MKRRGLARVLLVAALIAVTSSVALAYFTASGTGSGAATTGTTVNVTLSPATPTAELYPGGSAGVRLTVSNPNPSPVVVESLMLDSTQGSSGYAVDAGHSGCSTAALTYTTQNNGGSGWTVPARVGGVNGSLSITLAASLAMNSAAANACQGATFTVYLKAGP